VYGPKRAVAWRVLDAQYFGLAQRRRRVFVVASARRGFDPAEVLFEREGVRRDTAPRRGTGQDVAGRAPFGPALQCGCGYVFQTGLGAYGCPNCEGDEGPAVSVLAGVPAFGAGKQDGSVFQAPTLTATGGRLDFDSEVFAAVAPTIPSRTTAGGGMGTDFDCDGGLIAHTLRGEGFDGTGRGTPLVPVAFTTKLHNTQSNQAGKVYENYATSLDANSPPPALLTAMQVRRLTPVECERLQGFPLVVAKLTFDVCIDHQSSLAHVAVKCHRSLSSASLVVGGESMLHANTAGQPSSTSQAGQKPLAVLRVRMHSEDELLELRSLGRLIWSANGAPASNASPPPTLSANTVQELARLSRDLATSVGLGRAESLPSISLSTQAPNGARLAQTFTAETEACAMSAVRDQSAERFTTLSLGHFAPTSDSTTATLFCCAARAIAGSIPATTLSGSFSFEIEVSTPYTAIPWRKKPASECPDGPRYKALGNSWAVFNVRWIGFRIEEQIRARLEVA
jgi:DNA (cytosine-5)-methyltransferase 1